MSKTNQIVCAVVLIFVVGLLLNTAPAILLIAELFFLLGAAFVMVFKW